MRDDEDVLIGLPDTVWFPIDGFSLLPAGELSFLLFPVGEPGALRRGGHQLAARWLRSRSKPLSPDSNWVWGAFRMPAQVFRALHALWAEADRGDEYVGTLINAYLARGGHAIGVRAGERYFDVGTIEGYRAAIDALTKEGIGRLSRRPRARAPMSPLVDDQNDRGAAWLAAMRRGDFAEAWRISDRVLLDRLAGGPCWDQPRHEQWVWDGRPLAGRRVLVRCYHGLGDTIQFARFLPQLQRLARQTIVWAQPSLVPLLQTSLRDSSVVPLDDGTPPLEYDVDIEIMELAHALRVTLATLPADVPYFSIPSAARLSGRFSVGVVATSGAWDARRSVPAPLISRLYDAHVADWFNLQLDAPLPGLRDVSTTSIVALASRLKALDLVITADTMLAHLAGSLGVRTWTLLPFEADWRWLADRSDSPWYPTMRLFRQSRAGDWEPVVEEVRKALACAH